MPSAAPTLDSDRIDDAMTKISDVSDKVDMTKKSLQGEIKKVADNVANVVTTQLKAVNAAVSSNSNAISAEASRARSAESGLKTSISNEAKRASKVESDLQREIKAFFAGAGLSRNCAEVAKNHPNSLVNSAPFVAEVNIYPTGSVLSPKKVWCSITPPKTTLTVVSQRQPTSQASTCHGGSSGRAVDGNTNGWWGGRSVTHSCARATRDWWRVDLRKNYNVKRVSVWNRVDCCWTRLRTAQVRASTSSNVINNGAQLKLVRGSFSQRSGEIRTEFTNAKVRSIGMKPSPFSILLDRTP